MSAAWKFINASNIQRTATTAQSLRKNRPQKNVCIDGPCVLFTIVHFPESVAQLDRKLQIYTGLQRHLHRDHRSPKVGDVPVGSRRSQQRAVTVPGLPYVKAAEVADGIRLSLSGCNDLNQLG